MTQRIDPLPTEVDDEWTGALPLRIRFVDQPSPPTGHHLQLELSTRGRFRYAEEDLPADAPRLGITSGGVRRLLGRPLGQLVADGTFLRVIRDIDDGDLQTLIRFWWRHGSSIAESVYVFPRMVPGLGIF